MYTEKISEYIINIPTWLIFILQYFAVLVMAFYEPDIRPEYLLAFSSVQLLISLAWLLSFFAVMNGGEKRNLNSFHYISCFSGVYLYSYLSFVAGYYAFVGFPSTNDIGVQTPWFAEKSSFLSYVSSAAYLYIVSYISYLVTLRQSNEVKIAALVGRFFIYLFFFPFITLIVNRYAKKVVLCSRA